MESAKDQMPRFAGRMEPSESNEAIGAREDALLLRAIGEGKQQALATLYRRRGNLLYSLLIRMLANEMEAQEVIQDTFVRIWKRAAEFDGARSAPMTWIIQIARGLAMDRLRARGRRSVNRTSYEEEIATLEAQHVNGVDQALRSELNGACVAALHRLPEGQSRALQLAFFRGWTHEEIAQAEGEPLGTIKARIRRGLLTLRRALKDYHD